MSNIFRKASLDRLASPEQLDKMIKVTSPMVWLASVAIVLVIAVTVVWAFVGRLPEKVEIHGLYTSDAQVHSIFAPANGIIDLLVSKDDIVKAGQVIAVMDDRETRISLNKIEQVLADLESITLDSENDPASSDLSPLLEIKTNYKAATISDEQLELQIALLEKECTEQEKEVTRLRGEYNAARNDYLRSMDNNTLNAATYDFQKASELLSVSSTMYQNAAAAEAAALQAYQEVLAIYGDADPITLAAQQQYQQAQKALQAAQQDLAQKQKDFDTKLAIYEKAVKNQDSVAANTQKLYLIFSEKNSLYSNAYGTLNSMRSNLKSMKIQLESNEMGSSANLNALKDNFNMTKSAMLSQLNAERNKLETALDSLEIKAVSEGVVTALSVQNLQIIGAGTEILKLKPLDVDDMIVVFFVPLTDAKKFQPGMEVRLTPSTVNEQEFGHMNGKITSVASSLASTQEMRDRLGDDLMVSGLQQQGPSLEVIVTINRDANTVSGYEWSNKKGAEIFIGDGTVMNANVITDSKAPITKLLPYLKEKLKVKVEKSD
ncbi:MAG: HlyD family efflux transporter periplasmic adaptor subunit [Saccharofermentanales bacterium]|jgi:HlyD family secretion protein